MNPVLGTKTLNQGVQGSSPWRLNGYFLKNLSCIMSIILQAICVTTPVITDWIKERNATIISKRKILTFTNKISKHLSKPNKKFTADITYGILASKSCLLTDVAEWTGM